ncbi:MAG: glycosyltransferase family 2 protein [Leptospira sp.]|nr:glycosyltransferase family 2 protein [Leptospira sp.]
MKSILSIIIPFFNRKEMLLRAIQSVWEQSLLSSDRYIIELVLVDDGSTDGSSKEAENWLKEKTQFKEFHGFHFEILSQPHRGVSAARNLGVSHSKGEWILFLDSDDEWDSKKLEIQMNFHEKNPEFLISQTEEIWIRNGVFVNPHNKHQKMDGWIFDQSLLQCMITPSSVCIKKKLWEEMGGMDEELPACEDYDLWLGITSQVPVALLSYKLLKRYAGHNDQLSFHYNAMDRFRIYSMIKRRSEFSPVQKLNSKIILISKLEIIIQGRRKRKKDSKVLLSLLEWVNDSYENQDASLDIMWKVYLLNSQNWN